MPAFSNDDAPASREDWILPGEELPQVMHSLLAMEPELTPPGLNSSKQLWACMYVYTCI